MSEQTASIRHNLVGSWQPAHRRYAETQASEACVLVGSFFDAHQIDGYQDFTAKIISSGRSGDICGETDEANAIIYAHRDELVHRKLAVPYLGNSIAHEIAHLLRDRQGYPLSIAEAMAHEGIAYLVGATVSSYCGDSRNERYLFKMGDGLDITPKFLRIYKVLNQQRVSSDKLFDEIMYDRRYLGTTMGRKNRSPSIGIAVGVRLAVRRQREGVTLANMIALPTEEFFKGGL